MCSLGNLYKNGHPTTARGASQQHKLLIPIFTLTLTSTLTPTPTRFGPKMGLYLSYRPLDRTKSISAPSSNFDPETKKCENRSHFWAGASLGGPGTFPGKLNFTLIHLNSFNFTLIICADSFGAQKSGAAPSSGARKRAAPIFRRPEEGGALLL